MFQKVNKSGFRWVYLFVAYIARAYVVAIVRQVFFGHMLNPRNEIDPF